MPNIIKQSYTLAIALGMFAELIGVGIVSSCFNCAATVMSGVSISEREIIAGKGSHTESI